MFGFFKKKRDFDIYVDTGIPMVSFFYKAGIHASNDNLLHQNKYSVSTAYEKITPMYGAYNSYIVEKNVNSFIDSSEREMIVHYIMFASAFLYGYNQENLDESKIRDITTTNCDILFEDKMNFILKTNNSYLKIYHTIRDIYKSINPGQILL